MHRLGEADRNTHPSDPTSPPPAAVLIMAKAPRPGLVKTRLHPLLGPHGAAALQAVLIRHTATLAGAAAATFLAYDPPDAAPQMRRLVPASVTLFPQRGGNLGERMAAAAAHVNTATGGPVLVLGTDAPTLTEGILRHAGDLLGGEVDAVLGPALDGGYYLIGLARPTPAAFAIDPGLWSGNRVLAATLAALAGAGRRTRLLETLRDLDTPDDAAALRADPAVPATITTLLQATGDTT